MPFRTLLIIVLWSCLWRTVVCAQQAKLDSLIKMNQQYKKEDTVKVKTLNRIAYTLKNTDPEKGLEYAEQAITLSGKIKHKRGIADGYLMKGANYLTLGNSPEALKYFQNAARIYERIGGIKEMGMAYSGIGNVYMALNDSQALFYYHKSVDISRQLGNKFNLAADLSNIGYVYIGQAKRIQSLPYLSEALDIQKRIGDKEGMAYSYYRIGSVYFSLTREELYQLQLKKDEQYPIALDHFQKSMVIHHELGNIYGQSMDYGYIGDVYFKQKKYALALEYAQKSVVLAHKTGALLVQCDELNTLSNIYATTRRYDSAYVYLKRYTILKDSLNNSERDKDLIRKEMQFQFNRKEDSFHFQNQLLSKNNALNKLRLRQQWIYSIGGLLLLTSIVGFYFYRSHNRQAKLKSEFERRVSEAALVSLRSQMNPHFIFNCLNSIKLYAAENDSEAATEYLDKFSRLIRLVLENSERERILLSRELETLRLYMEMEQVRFKEKLQYEITVEDTVDIDYVEVPPMLIQPYIENAIWHGLMHKPRGGKVWIRFSYRVSEHCITVRVKDNGIGRAKAAEIKSRSVVHNQSYGMKITQERISLINQKYRTEASVAIEDLYDDQQQPAGTEVIIKIPIE